MAWTLTALDALAVVDGALIVAIGAFVLAAQPHGETNRAFFGLALADGASTVFYQLRDMTDETTLRLVFMELYWVSFIPFVVLLTAFGLLFPAPLFRRMKKPVFWGIVGAVMVLAVGAFVVSPASFWRYLVPPSGAGRVEYTEAGRLILTGFLGATGLILLRLGWFVVRGREPSHRKQAAFVLAGMTLAYVPYPVTALAGAMAKGLGTYLFASRWDTMFAYWCYFAVVALAAASLIMAVQARTPERGFLLAALGGVTLFAAVSIVFEVTLAPRSASGTSPVTDTVALVGLLAYPLLLAYAILRFEVFDIDSSVRRAAFVSLAGLTLAALFTIAGALAETMLEDRLQTVAPLSILSALVAAGATSLAFKPITKMTRKAVTKVIPELSTDQLQLRKLEVYRHSLSGAHADGILTSGESRTLQALRETLGISMEEHERIYHEVIRAAT